MVKWRRWIGRWGAIAMLAGGAVLPRIASADSLEGARSDLVVERDHTIRLTMGYDHANLVVRRTVHNGGERHDQATYWLDVPHRAVAAGLRTLGEHNGRPRWFEADLLEAEAAAERYRELTGIGGYYPKDPALLSWRSQDQLALQVFPVAPRSLKTVEYTYHLPTEYADGRYHVTLPAMGLEHRPADLVLGSEARLDQLFVDGKPVGRGTHVTLDRQIEIALARRDPPRLEGRLASLPFGDERVLVQYRFHAAAKLSEVPRDAHIVVLLDGSRSLSEDAAAAQVAAARAYLRHFAPRKLRAKAEVVVFARTPQRRHGRLVDVDRAIADLEHLALTLENGSHVDAAMATALEVLGEARRGAPRRVVLFTDTMTRSALPLKRLRAAARRSGAVVHVVSTTDGAPDLDRHDGHTWDAMTRPTGGLVWQAVASEREDEDEMRHVFEELARPVRVDHLEVLTRGLSSTPSFPDQLVEGEGFSRLIFEDSAVRHVVVRGQLWSRPVREVVTPDAEHGRLWAGLVFGSDLLRTLDEAEMMTLAMYGQVVSPVTSFLAIEPGVRPSTEGLDWGEGTLGLGGLGLIGKGGGGGFGRRSSARTIDPDAWLQDRLVDGLNRCGADGSKARVEMETTLAEVVDLPSVRIEGADAITHDCVSDEMWAVALPASVFRQPFAAWTVRTG